MSTRQSDTDNDKPDKVAKQNMYRLRCVSNPDPDIIGSVDPEGSQKGKCRIVFIWLKSSQDCWRLLEPKRPPFFRFMKKYGGIFDLKKILLQKPLVWIRIGFSRA